MDLMIGQIPHRTCLRKLAIGLLSLGLGVASAQTCKLNWAPTQSCLNISNLNGDTVVLPSNVTRLNQSGLSLCPLTTSNSKLPAVIFVMDQSASMDSAYGATPAGDPYHWRANLVRNAISYLHNVANTGWFSYVEFANGVETSLIPEDGSCIDGWNESATKLLSYDFQALSDSTVAAWTAPTGPIQTRCQSGTDYYSALTRVKQYAANFDPGDLNAEVSVIYVSDGRPNKSPTKTFDPLDTNFFIPGVFPPIHGIFLGADSTNDGDVLAQLSDSTGGTYNIVTPGDTAAMNSVMNSIIEFVSRFSAPSVVTLKVNGISYTASQVVKTTQGYQVAFPQTMPLVAGFNQMEMTISYVDSAGTPRTKTTTFTIATTDAPMDTGTVQAGDYFQADCAIGNGLTINGLATPQLVLGAGLANTPILAPTGLTNLSLQLSSIAYWGTTTSVRITSARTGDVLKTSLAAGASLGQFVGSAAVQVRASGIAGVPLPGDSLNSTLEIAPFDTLRFRWVNPEDARDTIVASLLVYEIPSANFLGDTLTIDQIAAQVTDVGAVGTKAMVEYLWSTGESVIYANLSRKDSGYVFADTTNMKPQLLSQLSERLVVSYKDPVFGLTYTDTTWLIFETPVLPIAWMQDMDGDGRADRLLLTYPETPSVDQHFPSFRLIWGNANQDTTFFRVDSLQPRISFDVVAIQQTAAGEQWIFDLSEPLPFAHTSGSGESGEGELTIKGWFANRNIERTIPVLDKMGPVLTELWVDPEDLTLAYFRASEKLSEGASQNWILVRRNGAAEVEAQAVSTTYNEATGVYTLTLVDRGDNRILSGDSVRFVPSARGGARDLNGNGAHVNNPAVLVKGVRFPENSITVSFEEALVREQSKTTLPPTDIDINTTFRVLARDPMTGDFTDPATGAKILRENIKGMPTLIISVFLPQLNGMDSSGEARQGMIVDGVMAWVTTVNVQSFFYDQVGQFITKKTAKILIDDTTDLRPDGTMHFSLLWQTDPMVGLTDQSGRAIGTGVLLTKTLVSMESEAVVDLDLYDATGVVSSNSIHKGDKIRKTRTILTRLGYLRQ